MKKQLLTVQDIVGAWAIMPTPAKANGSDCSATDTVDLGEVERSVEALVSAGINGLLTLGTLGECATLTWEEKRSFIATVVEIVNGRVPVFGGSTSLNTRESIYQTRAMSRLGVDGVMLGPPMWCAPDVATAVQFYQDVAQACPDTAICIYANNEAFKFGFPRSFWAKVAEIPQVVSAKYLGIGALYADLNVTKRRIRFLPIDADYYAAARIDPDFCKAFWTSGAVCGPTPVLRLRDEIDNARAGGAWDAAKATTDAIGKTYQTLFPEDSFRLFSMYNISLEKARIDAAGWMKAGPCRPPYYVAPEIYLEGARESGTRWAALDQEYITVREAVS